MISRKLLALAAGVTLAGAAHAQVTLFSQDWTNIGLITVDDTWGSLWNAGTGIGIVGFRGDDITTATGTDPRTLLVANDGGVLDVNANQTNPTTFTTGGVTEFHLANPTIALTGSGTADAPYLIVGVSTTGFTGVSISYNLRDLDASTDDAVQQFALHYRLGTSGAWTNLAGGYVADASTGPSLATLVTPVSVTSSAFDNAAVVQFRIMTTNAAGNDEYIGVDDITVTAIPEPSTYAAILGAATLGIVAWRRRSRR